MIVDECPVCGEGPIVSARIKRLNMDIFICEECEAFWLGANEIGVVKSNHFPGFSKENGLSGLWSELEILD